MQHTQSQRGSTDENAKGEKDRRSNHFEKCLALDSYGNRPESFQLVFFCMHDVRRELSVLVCMRVIRAQVLCTYIHLLHPPRGNWLAWLAWPPRSTNRPTPSFLRGSCFQPAVLPVSISGHYECQVIIKTFPRHPALKPIRFRTRSRDPET